MLERVARAMRGAEQPWWIIGSAAVWLHGGATEVRDIDVALSAEDAATLLPELGVEPAPGIADGLFQSQVHARWAAGALTVEFMAGLTVRGEPVHLATREPVDVSGVTVFVPSRSELLEILRRFGRPKDLVRAAALEASRSAPPSAP